MSLRTRVLVIAEIFLRVPPLFVIDEILKVGISDTIQEPQEFVENLQEPTHDPRIYHFILITLGRILLSSLGCLGALCLFILNMKQLMLVYMYFISVGVVFLSYGANSSTMRTVVAAAEADKLQTTILEDFLSFNFAQLWHEQAVIIWQNLVLQTSLLFLFSNLHMGPRHAVLQKALPLSFLGPTFLAMLPVPVPLLNHAAVFAALLPLAFVKFVLWASLFNIIQNLHSGYLYAKNYINNLGISELLESEWVRLSIPEVLRTFWILRVLEHVGIFFVTGLWNAEDTDLTPAFRLIKNTMVTGCDTLVAILGITSVVSYLCHYVGKFFQWILLIEDDNDKGLGAVSAILFYILALQTGLTGLDPEKRFVRLCRNFCLLFTALLHFIHNIVNPLLMSLSASHNRSLKRHLRALAVCAFLVLFPILLLTYLWSNHSVSTWLLAVSAFSVEIIVKVAVSLCIYWLFILDARTDTFWEGLDDYVYYIRAFGNTVEFCFGIFLFFNGAWILVFESGGAIRAVMMCIHAYFNIWCDAKAGWSVFMKRRTAVNKIDSLPEAANEQLARLDDVCAICYQEMKTAKITKCNHFFHGLCLRKWLYVQDRCPLCHEILHCVDYENGKAGTSATAQGT